MANSCGGSKSMKEVNPQESHQSCQREQKRVANTPQQEGTRGGGKQEEDTGERFKGFLV